MHKVVPPAALGHTQGNQGVLCAQLSQKHILLTGCPVVGITLESTMVTLGCSFVIVQVASSTTHPHASVTSLTILLNQFLAGVPSWTQHTPCCQPSSRRSSRACHLSSWYTGRCSSQQAAAAATAWHGFSNLQQHSASTGGVGSAAGLCQATAAAGAHATTCGHGGCRGRHTHASCSTQCQAQAGSGLGFRYQSQQPHTVLLLLLSIACKNQEVCSKQFGC
jgi:hypothetical protein